MHAAIIMEVATCISHKQNAIRRTQLGQVQGILSNRAGRADHFFLRTATMFNAKSFSHQNREQGRRIGFAPRQPIFRVGGTSI